jgi:hypothetical protein
MPNTVSGSDRLGAGGAFARLRGVTPAAWAAAAVGGFVGSIPLGLVMRYGNPEPLIELALPAMYGLGGPDPFAGWAIHQFHGVVLAFLYVGAVQREPLATWAERYRGALGLAVAVVRTPTATLSVLVMPVWLGAVDYPFASPVPDLAMPEKAWSVLGHVGYALPVTAGYAIAIRG